MLAVDFSNNMDYDDKFEISQKRAMNWFMNVFIYFTNLSFALPYCFCAKLFHFMYLLEENYLIFAQQPFKIALCIIPIMVWHSIWGHSITTWTRWGGGVKKYPFCWRLRYKKCPRGGGQKRAKLCPRSCWMPPIHNYVP